MKKNKKLIVTIVVGVLTVGVIGGAMAYFTGYADTKRNEFSYES